MTVRIVYGNRLDALADRLIADTAAEQLPPLVAQTVVVGHAGVGQWLTQYVAIRDGIAAHLDLPLPGAWMWRVLRASVPGLPEISAWAPLPLALRIDALLGEPLPQAARDVLAGWQSITDPAARWRLAQRLARTFDTYLLYRPDWLLAWESERCVLAGDADERWQAALWRELVGRCREPHRARLLRALADAEIALDPRALPAAVRVFGVATLAPTTLTLLDCVARRVPVTLYVLTPCAEWWADLDDTRRRAARLRRLARQGQVADAPVVQHALLESLGAVGRDFQAGLYAHFEPIDEEDASVEPAGGGVLAQVQRSMLHLDQAGLALQAPPALSDASLRMYPCASEQREVEVLRESVLRALEEIPGLMPRDIAVLSPDPSRYASLIEAVFGDDAAGMRIAVHLGDRDACRRLPLLEAWLGTLEPGVARDRLHDVLALFDHAALRRRHAIDPDEVALARDRLAAAGMRWGLDGQARRAAGAGDDATGTWAESRRRLLVAHALGEDDAQLVGELVTTDGVDAATARALAAVFAVVEQLEAARALADLCDDPAGWRERLLKHFDALFAIDARNDDELDARQTLVALLDDFAAAATAAGVEARLPLAAIHEMLTHQVHESRSARPWLGAGVCVAGMVPLRSVPFRMIALLGVDADSFPRRPAPDPFDLTRRYPRLGDRDRARDDHWLLLEALCSCGERLHVSWVTRDARGYRVRPPSPAVQLIVDGLCAALPAEQALMARARLVMEPPPTPWDPAHYRGNSPWHSSDPRYLPPTRRTPAAPFAPPRRRAVQGAVSTLETMIDCIQRPARAFLAAHNIGRMDDLPPLDDEDWDSDALARYRVGDALIQARWHGADSATVLARAQADGWLPPGDAGRRRGHEIRESVEALLAAATEMTARSTRPHRLASIAGTVALHGGDTLLLIRPGSFRWHALLADWVRLCALAHDGVQARLVVLSLDARHVSAHHFTNHAAAAQWETLSALAALVRSELPPWLPRSAGAAAECLFNGRDEHAALSAAIKAWRGQGGEVWRGEGDAPDWRVAMRGRDPLAEPEFLEWARRVYAPLYDAGAPAP